MVDFSVSKTLAVAIAVLAGCLTGFHTPAFAAHGTINIQTVPEGARYVIVESRGLKTVAGGTTPYFDMVFPTGKYAVCFQLDGYLTTWQSSYVQTSGSAWAGPVMKPSNNVAQSTCEEIIARVKAEKEEIRASLLRQLSAMGPISWSTGDASDVPVAVSGGQAAPDPLPNQQPEIIQQRQPGVAGDALRQKRIDNPRPVNKLR